MRRATRWAGTLGLCLALSGCYTVTYQASGGEDMPFETAPGATQMGSFKRVVWTSHFIYGLITPSEPDVVGVILDETRRRNGGRAAGLRITHERTFVDSLLAGITLGIFTPTTTTVEGEVVK